MKHFGRAARASSGRAFSGGCGMQWMLAALLTSGAAQAAAPPLFTIADPRGDDHGDGSLIYPRRDDLRPGDLDLLSLTASPDPEGTAFEATFARPTLSGSHSRSPVVALTVPNR